MERARALLSRGALDTWTHLAYGSMRVNVCLSRLIGLYVAVGSGTWSGVVRLRSGGGTVAVRRSGGGLARSGGADALYSARCARSARSAKKSA